MLKTRRILPRKEMEEFMEWLWTPRAGVLWNLPQARSVRHDTIVSTYQNIGTEANYGVSVFASVPLSSRFSINGGVDVYYRILKNNSPDPFINASNSGLVKNVRVFGNYNFSKGWAVQFFSFFQGRNFNLQGYRTNPQYSILSSIGADFPHGGFGLKNDNGWNGYKITTPGSPLLEGTGLKSGDIIDLPSGEYDGTPIKAFDIEGFPILDYNVLNFRKIELIGFDKGSRFNKETIGTFIVFKRTEKSGIIVNAASYDWCSERGMGGHHGNIIKKITYNAVEKLLKYESVFSN